MKRAIAAATIGALALGAYGAIVFGAGACGPQSFDPISKVTTPRILAARIDEPYAKPGDVVTIELLYYAGLPTHAQARLAWVPLVCVDPTDDLYSACFASLLATGGITSGAFTFGSVVPDLDGGFEGGLDGGLDGGDAALPVSSLPSLPPLASIDASALLQPGADLSPYLPSGTRFTFRVPPDIVTRHAPITGAPQAYGLAIAFSVACTEHVAIASPDAASASIPFIPFGCFDDAGNQLSADDSVVGFTRVFSYDAIQNANPVLSGVTFDGKAVDVIAGITVAHCTEKDEPHCPGHTIDVNVPSSSQESEPDAGDGLNKERVWAAYYVTDGAFDSDVITLYDPVGGAVADTSNTYRAPLTPGEHTMWVVVHDDRGGADWTQFPVHVP